MIGWIFVVVQALLECFTRRQVALLSAKRISGTDCTRSIGQYLSDAEPQQLLNTSLKSIADSCLHLFGPLEPIMRDWLPPTLYLAWPDRLWMP